MLWCNVGNHAAAAVNGFAVKPLLQSDKQIAVEQTTHTHQHNSAVRSDIAQLVDSTGFGGQHQAMRARLQLDPPTGSHQRGAYALGGSLHAFVQAGLCAVAKGFQALLAHAFFVDFQVSQNLGRVAADTQAGRDHQKSQDQQKPPSAVHRRQADG